jgi:acetolactate synthase-1/3 small subunit
VHTQNRPEALARVVMLFHRRALNIESLTWTRITRADTASMTITVEADSHQSLRIEANLNKLVDVLRVESITNQSVSSE